MRLLFALFATLAGALLPRHTEQCTWTALKRGCAYVASRWMTLGVWCGLQAEAAKEADRLGPQYRRDALAELGER